MYWQYDLFRSGVTWTNGGTYIEELPKDGLLSSILVHAYRGGVTDSMLTTGNLWRLHDFIDPFEIVLNGSDKAYTLSGQVGRYFDWLDGSPALLDKRFNYGSSTKRHHTLINFGRYFQDPVYGLDLSKFNSVEVKFTNSGSSTYFGGDWSLDLILVMKREDPSAFRGYMRKEEWRKWTTVSDEWKYLELPTAHRIRRIVMQVIPDEDGTYLAAEATPYHVLSDIKLLLDSGRLEMFNGNLRDLWYINAFDMGRDIIQGIEPYHTQDYGIWTGLGQTLGMGGVRIPHDGVQDTATTSITPGDDSSSIRRMTDTDSDQDSMIVAGLSLENCSHFRFDHDPNPETWLDPNARKTVRLDCHTDSGATYADGTIRVCLDRYVPYTA